GRTRERPAEDPPPVPAHPAGSRLFAQGHRRSAQSPHPRRLRRRKCFLSLNRNVLRDDFCFISVSGEHALCNFHSTSSHGYCLPVAAVQNLNTLTSAKGGAPCLAPGKPTPRRSCAGA